MGVANGENQVWQVDLTQENPDQRVNQVCYQGFYDRREGRTNDNPNGQVHHIPATDKFFEFFDHNINVLSSSLLNSH